MIKRRERRQISLSVTEGASREVLISPIRKDVAKSKRKLVSLEEIRETKRNQTE